MTRHGLASIALAIALACGAASAQETHVWSDIDCSQSRLKAESGLKCRATQEYAGGTAARASSGAGGTFRRWTVYGELRGVKFYYFMGEATAIRSNWRDSGTLKELLQSLSPQGKGARDVSELKQAGGADYVRFTSSSGLACVAIHKSGPSQSGGYKWQLTATRCSPSGRGPMTEAGIERFATDAGYKE
jgi:hypothetical protein